MTSRNSLTRSAGSSSGQASQLRGSRPTICPAVGGQHDDWDGHERVMAGAERAAMPRVQLSVQLAVCVSDGPVPNVQSMEL